MASQPTSSGRGRALHSVDQSDIRTVTVTWSCPAKPKAADDCCSLCGTPLECHVRCLSGLRLAAATSAVVGVCWCLCAAFCHHSRLGAAAADNNAKLIERAPTETTCTYKLVAALTNRLCELSNHRHCIGAYRIRRLRQKQSQRLSRVSRALPFQPLTCITFPVSDVQRPPVQLSPCVCVSAEATSSDHSALRLATKVDWMLRLLTPVQH